MTTRRRRLEGEQPGGSKLLVDAYLVKLRAEAVIRYDEDAHVGGQSFENVPHRAVEPLVDFVNKMAELGGRLRVVARVRGVHVGPVIMLRAVEHRKDDHQ